MANADSRIRQLSEPAWHRLEQTIGAFEQAWEAGQRPVLADYLVDQGDMRAALLFELAAADLEYRLRAGEIACADDYFVDYPELRIDHFPEFALELAARLGPAPNPGIHSTQEPGNTTPAEVATDGPPQVAGYAILGLLGRGGMGVVYRANHIALNRVVALKVIRGVAAADAAVFARFQAEAEAIARLQHPNIVQIHDVGVGPGSPYLAMEYVAGGNLATRLANAPLNPDRAAELMAILARATHVAHQAGILHRDLKPANVLMTLDGTPKIADFGLSKPLENAASQTLTGEVIGTPSYMAPEQAQGKTSLLGPPADVYALGAILYESLVGIAPFRGATPLETLDQVRTKDPVPPQILRPQVPCDLQTICLKSLSKTPARRYPTAEALAEDLERFIAGRPIHARPASSWERGWKWVKRRPAVAAALAVSVLALITITGMTAGFSVRLKAERDLADQHREIADRQRDRAETSYRLARQAMDRGITKVREDPRFGRGDLEDVTRTMRQAETDFYEQFAQLQDDNPAFQAERAEAYFRLGLITAALATRDTAIGHYRAAIDIDRRLALTTPVPPAVEFHLAKCLASLATSQRLAGRPTDAQSTHQEAEALFGKLANDHPDDTAYVASHIETILNKSVADRDARDRPAAAAGFQRAEVLLTPALQAHPKSAHLKWLSACLCSYRVTIYQGPQRIALKEADLLKSIAIYHELTRDHPDDATYRRCLAADRDSLGVLYRSTNRSEMAVEVLLKAAADFEILALAHPHNNSYKQNLANCQSNIGMTFKRLRQSALAEEWLRKAIVVHEAIVWDNRDDLSMARELGGSYKNLGAALHNSGQLEAALPPLQRAVEILEGVFARDPPGDLIRDWLGFALQERSVVLKKLGRLVEALAGFERAVVVVDDRPDRLACIMYVALLQAEMGGHAKAIAGLERIAGEKFDDQHNDLLARVYAHAARTALIDATLKSVDRETLVERYAALAVQCLASAKATGYFQNPAHLKELQTDPELSPLRARADFQQLLR